MIKKNMDYRIVKKSNGRYSVKKRGGGYLAGDEKVKVLVEKNLIKASVPAKKEEPVEERAAEAAAAAPDAETKE